MAEEQEEAPVFKVLEDNQEESFGFKSKKEPEQEEQEESQEEESSEEEQEQEQESSSESEEEEEEEEQEQEEEVDEDQQFLSSLEQKFGRKFESIDDAKSVLTNEEKKVPEYLEKFLEYQEKTGRDFSDYQKLERDLTKVNEDELIRQYMQETNEMLDNEDVDFEMNRQFGYDEEEDEKNDIKAKQIAKKRTYKEALSYFEQQKQEYSKPIGSIERAPVEESEEFKAFKQEKEAKAKAEEADSKRREAFQKESSKLFSKDFKGFEFNLGDKEVVYQVEDPLKAKEEIPDIVTFVRSFLNEDGVIKDAKGYHRALAIASNPEKYMKWAYEQGVASGILKDEQQSNNTTYNKTKPNSLEGSKGFKVLDDEKSGGDYVIRSRK